MNRLHIRALGYGLTLLALVGLAGCPQTYEPEIALTARTGPPPGKTAQLVHDDYEPVIEYSLTMSNGVVMTLDCWDSCDYYCESMTITADNPALVEVRPVFRLTSATTEQVIIAKAPGTGQLTVSNECATHTYDLTVLAD